MKSSWRHIKTIVDGENFKVNGLNIWDYKWNDTGEKITVTDPIYEQRYIISVYEIGDSSGKVKFGAVEFSNNIWGIYQE